MDLAQYAYKGTSGGQTLGFGRLKGPDRSGTVAMWLAWCTSQDDYVVTTADSDHLTLDWVPLAEERVDGGVSIQGISTGASSLRVTVLCDGAIQQSWVSDLEPGGSRMVVYPFVLNQAPAGHHVFKLRLAVDAGSLAIPAGLASWFLARRGN